MIARLVRYYRARKMRWAVRRLKNAGVGERLFLIRHRAHRRALHIIVKARRPFIGLWERRK